MLGAMCERWETMILCIVPPICFPLAKIILEIAFLLTSFADKHFWRAKTSASRNSMHRKFCRMLPNCILYCILSWKAGRRCRHSQYYYRTVDCACAIEEFARLTKSAWVRFVSKRSYSTSSAASSKIVQRYLPLAAESFVLAWPALHCNK